MKYIAIFEDQLNNVDVNGFMLMSENDFDKYEQLASSITWNFSYELGEDIIDYSNGEDLLSKIEFKEISIDEFNSLKKLFGPKFGTFITLKNIENIIGEEESLDNSDFSNDDYDNNYNHEDELDDF
jgi:hypothetical protein